MGRPYYSLSILKNYVVFQHLKSVYKRVCRDRARGNCFKLKEDGFKFGIRKNFCAIKLARPWKKLSRAVVDDPWPMLHPWKHSQ